MAWRNEDQVWWDWETEFAKPIPERVYNNFPWSREGPPNIMTPIMSWERYNVETGRTIWLPYNKDEHIKQPPRPVPWYDAPPWSRKRTRSWEAVHEDGKTVLILEDFIPFSDKTGRVFELSSKYSTKELKINEAVKRKPDGTIISGSDQVIKRGQRSSHASHVAACMFE